MPPMSRKGPDDHNICHKIKIVYQKEINKTII